MLASLCTILAMILYLPSAHQPADFIEQIRVEHAHNSAFWGRNHAAKAIARMLSWYDTPRAAPLMPPVKAAEKRADAVAKAQMEQVSHRLLRTGYVRSLDALAALGLYRVATIIEILPVVLILLAASITDGMVCRAIKSCEFMQHNPEIFSTCVCLIIALTCAAAIGLIYPSAVHPLALPAAMFANAALSGLALANYHRHG